MNALKSILLLTKKNATNSRRMFSLKYDEIHLPWSKIDQLSTVICLDGDFVSCPVTSENRYETPLGRFVTETIGPNSVFNTAAFLIQ